MSNPHTRGCPTEAELAAYHLGDLPEDLLNQVAEHLEQCNACEQRAGLLDSVSDPLLSAIRLSVATAGLSSLHGSWQLAPRGADRRGEPLCPQRYEVLGLLGEGGMGVVYKARDLKLNRVVALKMIASGRRRILARFRSEAEAIARLQHPHIVQIFEIGGADDGGSSDQDTAPYLALEYVEGGSLEKRLTGTPELPRQAAGLIRTLALAIDYAHQRGIIHRDLKPSNILIDSRGEPKITDFGVAKRLDPEQPSDHDREAQQTLAGEIMGTPRYMAPEQASGRINELGPAIDVYSLGVILYELLTGRVPHQAPTSIETLRLVREVEPVSPRRLQPRLSRDLETITLKCLRKESARRYANAKELADDLGRFLSGQPILARPTGSFERLYKLAKRQPLSATWGVLALLGLLTSAGVLWRHETAQRWYNSKLRQAAQRNLAIAHAEAKSRRDAETALYFSRISLAEIEIRANNVPGAEAHLAQCLPLPDQTDLRGWEWYYLKQTCHNERYSLEGNPGWVHSLAYSPDGKCLVAASGVPSNSPDKDPLQTPGRLAVWNTESGTFAGELVGHQGAVWAVAYRPDGRQIASAGADGILRLWDPNTLKLVAWFPTQTTRTVSLAYSPDGRTLAIGDSKSLTLRDLAADKILFSTTSFHGGLFKLAFSPDGKFVVAGQAERWLGFLDARTGRVERMLTPEHSALRCATFSSDGKVLAIAFADGVSLLVDATTGRMLHELRGHNGQATGIAISPDGSKVVTAGADQTVRLWNISNGSCHSIWRGHTFGVRAVAFRPDGRQVASAGQDGSVKLWDVQRDPRCLRLRVDTHGEWLGSFAFRVCSRRAELITINHYFGQILTWDVARGTKCSESLIDLDRHLRCPRGDTAFNADGTLLAGPAQSERNVVKLWDVSTGQNVQTLRGHAFPVRSLAFEASGRRVATAAWPTSKCNQETSGELNVWDRTSGQRLAMVPLKPGERPIRLAFSPDGLSLAGGGSIGSVVVRDPTCPASSFTLDGFRSAVTDIAFSPDNKLLAAVGGDDPTVRVWDLTARRIRHTLRGHKHTLTGLAFSPDGKRLASVGYEGAVKLWDVESGQEALSLTGSSVHRPDDYNFTARVLFSPDGTGIVANEWDGGFCIWDITPPADNRMFNGTP